MKLTIIPVDGAVYKDNLVYAGLDLSAVPSNIHALQWSGVKGWLEFVEDGDSKPANESISELPEWAYIALTKWDAAQAQEAAATQAAQVQPAVVGAQEL